MLFELIAKRYARKFSVPSALIANSLLWLLVHFFSTACIGPFTPILPSSVTFVLNLKRYLCPEPAPAFGVRLRSQDIGNIMGYNCTPSAAR
jgi:hypothetical protein